MNMDRKSLNSVQSMASVLIWAGVLLAGCGAGKPGYTATPATQIQATETPVKASTAACTAGATKTILGRTYTISGSETYTIHGQSYDLCCWQVGEGQKLRKICDNRIESPIGYDYGVLFEVNPKTGGLFKSMETYRDGTHSCQQFYDVDGAAGALNCQ
jgi:hypothetical protein